MKIINTHITKENLVLVLVDKLPDNNSITVIINDEQGKEYVGYLTLITSKIE